MAVYSYHYTGLTNSAGQTVAFHLWVPTDVDRINILDWGITTAVPWNTDPAGWKIVQAQRATVEGVGSPVTADIVSWDPDAPTSRCRVRLGAASSTTSPVFCISRSRITIPEMNMNTSTFLPGITSGYGMEFRTETEQSGGSITGNLYVVWEEGP